MMDLTWYILGVLTGAFAILLWKLSKRYHLNCFAWSGLIVGFSLILFSIAWAVSAVLEGVPRAASMGLILFGLSGIVLLTFTYKFIDVKSVRIVVVDDVIKAEDLTIISEAPKMAERAESPLKDKLTVGIRYAAYISLVIAFVTGMVGGKDYEAMIRSKFQNQTLTKVNDNPVVFQLGGKNDAPGNYILIQEGQGYGGPFVLGIRVMKDGKIHEVIPLDHKETPAFIKLVEDARYRDQFVGKKVSDDLIVDVDIDAVSGATITTMAAAEAIRKGAHLAAVDKLKLKPQWKKVPWKFGLDEILILAIFLLAFIPRLYKEKPWKYLYLTASIVIVGFYLNAAISVGNIAGLAMGYIPGIKDHLIWWILVVGTVLSIIILGQNVYCYRICPFYGIEYLLQKIGGMKLNPSRTLLKRSRSIVNFLLWLSLMVIFLSRHPAMGSYEPFAMMFSLNGVGIQWFLLPLALTGSFFISTFWCRFFCPCGQALTKLRELRENILKAIKPK